MINQRIESLVQKPPPAVWLSTCLSAVTKVIDIAYECPWRLRYDENLVRVELQNETLQTLRQVQIFSVDDESPFLSLPETVPPGGRIFFQLQSYLNSAVDVDGLLYVRWLTEKGVKLVWPIVW